MGETSKYHRYRDQGENPNEMNVEKFGEPASSLFISSKVISLHKETEITNNNEEVVYKVRSKALSIRDKTDITDAEDKFVAHMEKNVVSLHEKHFITMDDGTEFVLSNEVLHLIKDITNIEGLGWTLQGNIVGLNFELFDENNEIIAVISQKMLSIHDKYCVDIYQPEHEHKVVAIVIALQHMIRDRQESSSSISSLFDE